MITNETLKFVITSIFSKFAKKKEGPRIAVVVPLLLIWFNGLGRNQHQSVVGSMNSILLRERIDWVWFFFDAPAPSKKCPLVHPTLFVVIWQ